MDSIKNEILVAQKENYLLNKISELLTIHTLTEKELILIIKELHNSKEINIIDAILNYNKDSFIDELCQFYPLNSFLNNLLIELDIDLIPLIKCSQIIDQYGAITQLCSKNQNKAEQFFTLVSTNLNEFGNLLSISISTLDIKTFDDNLANIIKIIRIPKIDLSIKQQCIYALSRLTFINNIKDKDIDQIIKIIKQMIDQNAYRTIHGSILYLLATISVYFPNKETVIINLIDKIWSKSNEHVIQITAGLIFCIENIPSNLIDKIVNKIIKFDPSDLEKYQKLIDLSIKKLFASDINNASFLLENLLVKNKITLTTIDSTLYLISESEPLSNYFITKWLLSPNYVLQRNCSCIINNRYKDNKTITVDTTLLELSKNNLCLFLSQKVCGWLYYSPVSVISYIFSLLDVVKVKKEKEEIIKLLFKNIFLNYPNTFQNFIENNKKSFTSNIKKISTNLVKQYQEFSKNNEIEQTILELQPSITQREKYYKYQCDINDEITQKAHKNSLLGQIATTTVSLYGNSSLYYVNSLDGNQKILQKTPFHKFSHLTELPLESVVDNSSWEYLLFSYRVQEYTL